MIETPRLILKPFTEPQIDAIIAGNLQKLAGLLDAEVPENWQAIENSKAAADFFYQMIRDLEGDSRFGGYFVIHKEDHKLIGTAGYKGKAHFPNSVEIGYEIQSEYQRLGLATEAAKAMVDFARLHGVMKVTAQTLSDGIPSHRVLEKCGFEKKREVIDSEHGLLWDWERIACADALGTD